MGDTLARVRALLRVGKAVFSVHALTEIENDRIVVTPMIEKLDSWQFVEDYPEAFKGSSVLVLAYDVNGAPVHLLWGIPKERSEPAVLITAYRPDPDIWSEDLLSRRKT